MRLIFVVVLATLGLSRASVGVTVPLKQAPHDEGTSGKKGEAEPANGFEYPEEHLVTCSPSGKQLEVREPRTGAVVATWDIAKHELRKEPPVAPPKQKAGPREQIMLISPDAKHAVMGTWNGGEDVVPTSTGAVTTVGPRPTNVRLVTLTDKGPDEKTATKLDGTYTHEGGFSGDGKSLVMFASSETGKFEAVIRNLASPGKERRVTLSEKGVAADSPKTLGNVVAYSYFDKKDGADLLHVGTLNLATGAKSQLGSLRSELGLVSTDATGGFVRLVGASADGSRIYLRRAHVQQGLVSTELDEAPTAIEAFDVKDGKIDFERPRFTLPGSSHVSVTSHPDVILTVDDAGKGTYRLATTGAALGDAGTLGDPNDPERSVNVVPCRDGDVCAFVTERPSRVLVTNLKGIVERAEENARKQASDFGKLWERVTSLDATAAKAAESTLMLDANMIEPLKGKLAEFRRERSTPVTEQQKQEILTALSDLTHDNYRVKRGPAIERLQRHIRNAPQASVQEFLVDMRKRQTATAVLDLQRQLGSLIALAERRLTGEDLRSLEIATAERILAVHERRRAPRPAPLGPIY